MSRVLSVNVGIARPTAHSSVGITGIDKRPVGHPVQLSTPGDGASGVASDTVCDVGHHGGPDQAVYAYSREDLDFWGGRLDRHLPSGSFGENLTVMDVDLNGAVLGERWLIGQQAVLEISDPRIPCRTFAGFLGEQQWVRRFTEQGRAGTYLRVITPGPVAAGDAIRVLSRPEHGLTVAQAFRAFTTEPDLLPRMVSVATLSDDARAHAARRSTVGLDAS